MTRTVVLARGVVSLTLLLTTVAIPGRVEAQGHVVSGVVRHRGLPINISGAVVRLSGVSPSVTGADGRFAFSGLVASRYLLVATAFGFRPDTTELSVSGTLDIVIELEPLPFELDSLLNARDVRISGNIVDFETGDRLLDAQLTVFPGGRILGAMSGTFVLNVPRGDTFAIQVEGFEHLPQRVALVASQDTSITIALQVDSVAMAMTRQQVKRLNTRARGIPHSLRAAGRDEFKKQGVSTVGELLIRMLPPGTIPERPPYPTGGCRMLDDRKVAIEDLLHLPPDLIERVEVYGQKGRMIRVYTKRYVAGLARKNRLPHIMLMEIGLRSFDTVCS